MSLLFPTPGQFIELAPRRKPWRAGGDGRSIQIPGDVWDRIFGAGSPARPAAEMPPAADPVPHGFALAKDDEKIDVVRFDGVTTESTTVGSLRARGVL